MDTLDNSGFLPCPRQSDREFKEVFGVNGPQFVDVNVEPSRWYATVQAAGDSYEVCIRKVDEEAVLRMVQGVGARLGPKPTADIEDNEARAKQRAKKRVRLLCKQIAATHMLTLTTRQNENTPDWLFERFKRFVSMYRQGLGKDWEYVAVVERHPSNPKHHHLHVACHGFINVRLARKIWNSLTSATGGGNIDASPPRSKDRFGRPLTAAEVSANVGRYISKYLTKDSAAAFNKKRYTASHGIGLPESTRTRLDARTFEEAINEVCAALGICEGMPAVVGYFVFPYEKGCWIEVIPSLLPDSCPF